MRIRKKKMKLIRISRKYMYNYELDFKQCIFSIGYYVTQTKEVLHVASMG
jgi:hypothetical protein